MSYEHIASATRLQVFNILEEEMNQHCQSFGYLDTEIKRSPKKTVETFDGPVVAGKRETERRYILESMKGENTFDITVEDYATPIIVDQGSATEIKTEELEYLRDIDFKAVEADKTIFNLFMDEIYNQISTHAERYKREETERSYTFLRENPV